MNDVNVATTLTDIIIKVELDNEFIVDDCEASKLLSEISNH